MATSALRDCSSGGVAGAARAVATQSDGGSGSALAMLRIYRAVNTLIDNKPSSPRKRGAILTLRNRTMDSRFRGNDELGAHFHHSFA
jgi:hypothetical protein